MIVIQRQLSSAAMRIEITRLMQERRESITDATGRQMMIAAPTNFNLLPAAGFSNCDEMFAAFEAKLLGEF